MAQPDKIHDSQDNLVAYSKTDYEVLKVRFEERMDRLESNIGDARQEISLLRQGQEHMREQVSMVCNLTREVQNEIRIYINTQEKSECPEKINVLEKKMAVAERNLAIGAFVALSLYGALGAIWRWILLHAGIK